MSTQYSHDAHDLAEQLMCTAGELLEHVCGGAEFTKTAASMRELGELLIRMDRQLQPITASVAATAESD